MNLAYYSFALMDKLVGRMPRRLSSALAHSGSLVYLMILPKKRRLVERNMRRALGPDASSREVKRTARRAASYYADYWVDIFWLPRRSRKFILDRFSTRGEEALFRVLDEGKGMIVVLPHLGSWEAGGVFLSSLGKFAAVAEVLKPPKLFDLFVKLRAGVGIEIFPYDHDPGTRERLVDALKDGTILALLCDRDLKGSGVEVDFFGERTTLPPGPATLALKSGSPIVCVSVRNLDGCEWRGRATEPIYATDSGNRDDSIKDVMQQVAHRLEELIREDPAQWHMFMPAWPADRR